MHEELIHVEQDGAQYLVPKRVVEQFAMAGSSTQRLCLASVTIKDGVVVKNRYGPQVGVRGFEELIAAREAELNRRASVLGAAWQAVWAEAARRAGGFLREVQGVQNGRASR